MLWIRIRPFRKCRTNDPTVHMRRVQSGHVWRLWWSQASLFRVFLMTRMSVMALMPNMMCAMPMMALMTFKSMMSTKTLKLGSPWSSVVYGVSFSNVMSAMNLIDLITGWLLWKWLGVLGSGSKFKNKFTISESHKELKK